MTLCAPVGCLFYDLLTHQPNTGTYIFNENDV